MMSNILSRIRALTLVTVAVVGSITALSKPPLDATAASPLRFRGVQAAGGSFDDTFPADYGTTYIYPGKEDYDYFIGKGMNLFRYDFRWENMQKRAFAPLEKVEISRYKPMVDYVTGKGRYMVLDLHNYGRYFKQDHLIGGPKVPPAVFADFWRQMALKFKNNPRVIFGLQNEPNNMPTKFVVASNNAAIKAIRATGATNLILVQGNAWTGTSTWYDSWYGTPNAIAMKEIVDPLNKVAFEGHLFLDRDASGTKLECVNGTIGRTRLQPFVKWLRENKKRGFIGEFGAPNTPTCKQAVLDLLNAMNESSDVLLGWSWWAMGPWWGRYPLSLTPPGGYSAPEVPQLTWLKPQLKSSTVKPH